MVACSANSPDLEHPIPGLEQIFREYRALYESYTPTDARYLTLHKGHLMFVRPEEGTLRHSRSDPHADELVAPRPNCATGSAASRRQAMTKSSCR